MESRQDGDVLTSRQLEGLRGRLAAVTVQPQGGQFTPGTGAPETCLCPDDKWKQLCYITPSREVSLGTARSERPWLREVGILTVVFTAWGGTDSSRLCLPFWLVKPSPYS